MNYIKFTFCTNHPELHIDNWTKIKSELYPFNIKKKNIVLDQVCKNCNIIFNKNLPILKRHEGLLGGDSNTCNKQLRLIPEEYPHNHSYYNCKDVCSPILISYFDSGNKQEIWEEVDLADIVQSFSKTLYDILMQNCALNDTSLYIESVVINKHI